MEKHVRLTFSPELIKEPLIYEIGREFGLLKIARGHVLMGLDNLAPRQ